MGGRWLGRLEAVSDTGLGPRLLWAVRLVLDTSDRPGQQEGKTLGTPRRAQKLPGDKLAAPLCQWLELSGEGMEKYTSYFISLYVSKHIPFRDTFFSPIPS